MEQQLIDLMPYLRRIGDLISPDRQNDYCLIVGELLTRSPEAFWRQLNGGLDLPSDLMPKAKMRRKCHCPRCLRPSSSRYRKVQALIRLSESIDKPLCSPVEGESKPEWRIRFLEALIERLKLMEAAGLRLPTADGVESPYYLRQRFESELISARRQLRFERGDF